MWRIFWDVFVGFSGGRNGRQERHVVILFRILDAAVKRIFGRVGVD